MKRIFNYLLISNIFTTGFILFDTPFQFYIGYLFMLLFLLMHLYSYGKFKINRTFILILTLVSITSLLNIALGNNTPSLFLKQFYGFLFNGVTFYLFIRFNNNDISKLFRIYVKLSFIVAIIGIIQEFSFLIHFKPGYDFSYFIPRFCSLDNTVLGLKRISSILSEPAHFAGGAMAPAMFISVLNIIKKENNFISRKKSFLIIISILLSFSLIAYIGIIVALVLIMLNDQRVKVLFFCSIILMTGTVISYRFVDVFRMKINDSVEIISGKKSLDNVNLSTFSSYSNAFIAYKSIINNPLFGSGLGSHEFLYNKYIPQIIDKPRHGLGVNKGDASSLFLRLISETGLFGVFIFLYFIVKFYVPKKKDTYFWMISNAIVCLFILNLMRQGNYFYCGFIFFVWAYYFTNKNCCLVSNASSQSKVT